MQSYQYLNVQIEDAICTISINRPDKLNALNVAVIEELRSVFTKIQDHQEIKGVILTGEGEKAFAAGADIAEIAELNDLRARKFAENGQEVFTLIENCPKPVIAAVNGFALGGGCELAMACHFRIASANAKFGQPEVNLGLIPGYGGTQRLTTLIGRGRAMELMMTGDMLTAQEALTLGLVNHVLPDKATLIEKATEILKKIAGKAPLAIAMVVECVNAAHHHLDNGFQHEANSFAGLCKTQDFKEGTSAFVEKRKATFTGA